MIKQSGFQALVDAQKKIIDAVVDGISETLKNVAGEQISQYYNYNGLTEFLVYQANPYDGNTLDTANMAYLDEHWKELSTRDGGYTYYVTTDWIVDNPEEAEELKELIDGLECYPVFDDEIMSRIEWDETQEEWERFASRLEGELDFTVSEEKILEIMQALDEQAMIGEHDGLSYYFISENQLKENIKEALCKVTD